MTPYPLMASIGNNRPNAISENEPSCEPDYERNGELRHHVHSVCGFANPAVSGHRGFQVPKWSGWSIASRSVCRCSKSTL